MSNKAMSNRKRGYDVGSHNVFRDIGVPNPEEHLDKAHLVFKIDAIRKERRLKQVEMAGLLGIRQPDVSKMLRGEFRQFSLERLMRFLVALNQDVEIVVKPHRDNDNSSAWESERGHTSMRTPGRLAKSTGSRLIINSPSIDSPPGRLLADQRVPQDRAWCRGWYPQIPPVLSGHQLGVG